MKKYNWEIKLSKKRKSFFPQSVWLTFDIALIALIANLTILKIVRFPYWIDFALILAIAWLRAFDLARTCYYKAIGVTIILISLAFASYTYYTDLGMMYIAMCVAGVGLGGYIMLRCMDIEKDSSNQSPQRTAATPPSLS